jgi:hypothetical protein
MGDMKLRDKEIPRRYWKIWGKHRKIRSRYRKIHGIRGKRNILQGRFLSRKMSSDQSLRVSHYFQFIKTFDCWGYFIFTLKFHTLLISKLSSEQNRECIKNK